MLIPEAVQAGAAPLPIPSRPEAAWTPPPRAGVRVSLYTCRYLSTHRDDCRSPSLGRYRQPMSDPFEFRADVPKHVQIADELRERIKSGELRPRLPVGSEPSLMAEFGVARDTVRKALALLRDEGYVVTQPGMGSFVRDREDWPS